MSSSDGGSSSVDAVVGADEPEYFVDRAEARLADGRVNLVGDARHVLREMIHGGVELAADSDRELAPRDLEESLDRVIDEFATVIQQQAVAEVDAETLRTVWDAVCIYPWCRR